MDNRVDVAGATEQNRLRRCEGVDLTRVPVDPECGMLAARLDTPMSLKDAAVMMGWPVNVTRPRVDELVRIGVVEWVTGREATNYNGHVFPGPLMNAACDLTESQRKEVIWYYDRLDRLTYYDLLGAKRTDADEDFGRRFREASWKWHPDRWPQDLGPFKRMIDEIFKRLQTARSTLSNSDLRKDYDRQIKHVAIDDEQKAALAAKERRETRDLKLQRQKQERRRRRNPMRRVISEAATHAEQSKQFEEDGDFVAALRAAQTALTYDPRNPTYKAMVAHLSDKAAASRVEPLMKRGKAAESLAKWDQAVYFFEEAVRLADKLAEPKKRLAYNWIMDRREPKAALQHANRAVEAMPNDAEAHFILGLCQERSGIASAAERSYRRAIELKDNYKEARKRLRVLRWGWGF